MGWILFTKNPNKLHHNFMFELLIILYVEKVLKKNMNCKANAIE